MENPARFVVMGEDVSSLLVKQLGIIGQKTVFAAFDGIHEATIVDNVVSLSMADVNHISVFPNMFFWILARHTT